MGHDMQNKLGIQKTKCEPTVNMSNKQNFLKSKVSLPSEFCAAGFGQGVVNRTTVGKM